MKKGAIFEEWLAHEASQIDITDLANSEVEEMEKEFSGSSLFKYYSSDRRDFFTKPQIRFTQKSSLNDPFDLTQRWENFESKALIRVMSKNIESSIKRLLKRKDILADDIKEEALRNGYVIDVNTIHLLLQSEGAERFLKARETAVHAEVEGFVNRLFSEVNASLPTLVDSIISKMGVFSVSETGLNAPMWAHYASSGKGFVVEFNAQHPFFFVKRDTGEQVNAFRRIKYTNTKAKEFWQNPYYFFLVKNDEWSYEREWRMMKPFSECVKLPVASEHQDDVYICTVLPGMIRSIYLGYNCNCIECAFQVEQILKFDPYIQVYKVDLESGTMQLRLVDYPKNKFT